MTKARKIIEMLEELKMGSSDYQTFLKNVKKVKLKRDSKWYTVKGAVADKGISLVGHEPVQRDEIADVARA